MDKDIRLVEQIATFKRLPKDDSRWRVAFYYIAKEFWDLEEVFVIIDKALYEEQGLKIRYLENIKKLKDFRFSQIITKRMNLLRSKGSYL